MAHTKTPRPKDKGNGLIDLKEWRLGVLSEAGVNQNLFQ